VPQRSIRLASRQHSLARAAKTTLQVIRQIPIYAAPASRTPALEVRKGAEGDGARIPHHHPSMREGGGAGARGEM